MKQGASSLFTALYDGDGLRVNKSDLWTGNHDFSWGPGGVLFDSANGGTTYTPGLAQRQGATDRFFHTDWLGSTRYLSDSSGTSFPSTLRYDAFANHRPRPRRPADAPRRPGDERHPRPPGGA